MRKVKTMLAVTSLIAISAVSLVGCGKDEEKDPLLSFSKKELIELANGQMDEIDGLYIQLDEKDELLRGIQEEEVPSSAITEMGDGTGRLTFNSFQDMITFPVPFEYPGSTQISNTASVNITQNLNIAPTTNWSMKFTGTELQLEHSSGISGVIKAGHIRDVTDRDTMKEEVFQPFLAELPPDTVKYSKLFLDENWWGLQAMTPTFIDEEEAFLRVGMVGMGEQCFTYTFVYKGKQSAEKDETVLTLLKTVKLFNQNLRIEQ